MLAGGFDTTRLEVPMPPLNSWQIMPVPPPTLPSATGPPRAESSAAWAMASVTGKVSASESQPSWVSATTGRCQGVSMPSLTA